MCWQHTTSLSHVHVLSHKRNRLSGHRRALSDEPTVGEAYVWQVFCDQRFAKHDYSVLIQLFSTTRSFKDCFNEFISRAKEKEFIAIVKAKQQALRISSRPTHFNNRCLRRQVARFDDKPPVGISLQWPEEDDEYHIRAAIDGPKDTPYDGGLFIVTVLIPNHYPSAPPKMSFQTCVLHPNINFHGSISLDMISTRWMPCISLETALVCVQTLLSAPNFDSPLNYRAQWLYEDDRHAYGIKVRLTDLSLADHSTSLAHHSPIPR